MGTVGLANIVVQRGYWRASGATSRVYKCAVDSAGAEANCLGGNATSYTCAPVLSNIRYVSALQAGGANASSPPTTAVFVPNPGSSTALAGDGVIGNYTVSMRRRVCFF